MEIKADSITPSQEDIEALNGIIEELSVFAGSELIPFKPSEDFEAVLHQIEKYFQMCDGTSPELEATLGALKAFVEGIEDKYDEDTYALTEDELASIIAIYGECEITTLGELEEIIHALEGELDALKESITIDDAQREAIDDAKEHFHMASEQFKEELKNELESKMEQAKESFKNQKDDRRKEHGNHR